MIDNFLRPPRTPAQWLADILRVAATPLTLFYLFTLGIFEAGIMAFSLPGLMAPKFLGMRAWADIAFQLTVLTAALSNIYGLYAAVSWWDLVVHFLCGGAVACVAYLALARFGLIPLPHEHAYTPHLGIILTTAFGLALSAVWEMVEWIGFRFLPADVLVDYHDTITDMIAGGLGSLAAGLLLARIPLLRDSPAVNPTAARPGKSSSRSRGPAGRNG